MTQTLAQGAGEADRLADLEQYRVELRGYCYRMLGSTFDADDAVQDTFVKAWQGLDRFEGRSSLRSWLYRIATNVCLDSLRSRSRRALPMDLSSPVPAPDDVGAQLPNEVWVEPAPDGDVVPLEADPARRAVLQDSVRLAFVAALQQLPPRQRAVLVLREVLGWHAAEVAELLDSSVASVNSALQRARATLGEGVDADRRPAPLDDVGKALLARYVAAFEAYDIPALVALMREEASISMPPFALWMKGHEALAAFYLGAGKGCEGSRLVPLVANGSPAFAHYKPDPAGGHAPWSIQVLEIEDGRVAHVHHFLDPALFPRFGLPHRLQEG
jgi:RNA polymerase sigma-70 factor, ECF subfamily